MTDAKKKAFLSELTEYLQYDCILTEQEKATLNNLDYERMNGWGKTVFDYFYSHLSDDGNIISLENFLLSHVDLSEQQIADFTNTNDIFIKKLFSSIDPLIFLDVDNTLTEAGHLSQEKIDFISSFKEKDRIILTTGKAYESIKNVIDDCHINNNYASCLNGSILIEKGEQKCIAKVGAISEKIVALFDDAPFDCVVYYEDGIRLIRPLTQKNYELLKQFNESYAIEEKLDYSKVVKVLFFIYEGETDKELLVKQRIAPYPDLVCMRTAGHTFEILNTNQHKGNTVKIISKLMGRYYRNSVGVGDSMNDAQLLNYVGKAMVVSTANEELKKFGYEMGDKNRNTDIVEIIKKYDKI